MPGKLAQRKGTGNTLVSSALTLAKVDRIVRPRLTRFSLPGGRNVADDTKKILVVGGGIAGMTAALEAAEVGAQVVLIERNAYLGGRVAQMYQYFPKLCPPSCGMEINFKRLKSTRNIEVLTQAEVLSVEGHEGDFKVQVKIEPRYVNERCTCCGACAEACNIEVDDQFNYSLLKKKAAALPHPHAFPMRYVLDPELVKSTEAESVKKACEFDAINLDDTERVETYSVGSIIWATGWEPFDPSDVEYYGYGKYKNVITNVVMERLASYDGPTHGSILRPSDGKPPGHVVFVQCAGSRDENHLPYCSGICCLASLKQATYVRTQYPESRVTICFIDIRTPDRLEDFYTAVQRDEGIQFVKSKIADISEDETTGTLTLNGENTLGGERFVVEADLVVLATGIVPNRPAPGLKSDDYGFLTTDQAAGHHPAGCATRPVEVSSTVQDATAAALEAIQSLAVRSIDG